MAQFIGPLSGGLQKRDGGIEGRHGLSDVERSQIAEAVWRTQQERFGVRGQGYFVAFLISCHRVPVAVPTVPSTTAPVSGLPAAAPSTAPPGRADGTATQDALLKCRHPGAPGGQREHKHLHATRLEIAPRIELASFC